MTTHLQKAKEESLKEFRDFYGFWKKGKYQGRKLGLLEYESYLLSSQKKIIEALIEDLEERKYIIEKEYKGVGKGMVKIEPNYSVNQALSDIIRELKKVGVR